MAIKSFFEGRSLNGIRELNPKQVSRARGLMERVDNLSTDDALEIRVRILPGDAFRFKDVKTGRDASRKWFKHGEVVSLPVPKTMWEARICGKTPLRFRQEAFSKLETKKEEEINSVGYSTRVDYGDRVERFFPFVFMPEGEKIFSYAENIAGGIEVNDYQDSLRVRKEGANVVCKVPSRTAKKSRYQFRMIHVPTFRSDENLASVLQLRPELLVNEEGEQERDDIPHRDYSIRYTREDDIERSDRITFYPHDVAAYLAIIKKENSRHNLTPIEMSPFALFSRRGARIADRISNNVLIYDPTLKSNGKLRKLHLAERSVLLARAIGVFGVDEIAYWEPIRDGKIKDYEWSK